jgi:hypothetical protein
LKLEVFKRKDKYIIRIITYNEDTPTEKTKVIEETNLAKLCVKLQDEIYKEFETKDSSNPYEKK